jgi:GT2 family glycosyltransferase
MAPLVSFLLPTVGFQRLKELKDFFASVDAQPSKDLEVVLVDQGEPRLDTLMTLPSYVHYIYSERKGQCHNRNLGFQFTSGRLIVLADDDSVLPADYMQRLARVEHLLQGNVAFGIGKVINIEDGLPSFTTQFSFLRPHRKTSAWNVDTVLSCGIVFRRSALEAIGPFDERFGVGARYPASDELDMMLRLMERGHDGLYVPELEILHPRHVLNPEKRARYVSYAEALGAVARKHWMTAHNWLFLLRFGYSLTRSAGGFVLSTVRRNGLTLLYWEVLKAKLRGFREYRA